jgi:hypothetical protein
VFKTHWSLTRLSFKKRYFLIEPLKPNVMCVNTCAPPANLALRTKAANRKLKNAVEPGLADLQLPASVMHCISVGPK